MGTRRAVFHQIPMFMGQSSGYNPESVDPRKTRLSSNFYLQNGMLKKIPGSSLYLHSAYGSSPIVWLDWFERRAMWQLGQNLLIETAEGSQVEELLSSSFSTNRIFSDRWLESIYLANGVDLRFYNGTAVDELGLLPPGEGSVPRQIFVAVTMGSGSGFAEGQYRYTCTFFDSETQTESLPIGALPDELALFNPAEFDLENNPTGWISVSVDVDSSETPAIKLSLSTEFRAWLQNITPARVDVFRIYRAADTGSGLGDYQLLTGFPITNGIFNVPFTGLPSVEGVPSLMTNTFEVFDTTEAQADLFQVLLTEDIIPPPTRRGAVNAGAPASTIGPKILRFWRDSLFLFGSSFPEYEINDSFTGATDTNFAANSILYASDTSLPEYFPFNWEIGAGDGQEPTALAVVSDVLCIFKERSIYTLVGTSLNNFLPKIQDESRGCIASGSIQETPYGAIFLSEAGITRFVGSGKSEVLSNDILDEIQNINKSALSVISSSYDPAQEIYTLYYPGGTATQNTKQIQFSLKDAGFTVGQRNRFVGSATVIPKQNASQTSLIGTAAGGYLLNISSRDTVSDYDDFRITSTFRSSSFDFGVREKRKRLTWLYIKARCAINWIVDVAVYCDDGQALVYEAEDINSESDISYYASSQTDPDGAIYDESRYMGAQTEKKLKIPIEGIGYDFFVEITERTNYSERHSFDLLSVEVEAVLLER